MRKEDIIGAAIKPMSLSKLQSSNLTDGTKSVRAGSMVEHNTNSESLALLRSVIHPLHADAPGEAVTHHLSVKQTPGLRPQDHSVNPIDK